VKDFRTFYTLFLTKFIQDTIVNYFVNGTCSLVKLRNYKQNSLIDRMSSKMNEIFFSRTNSSNSSSMAASTSASSSGNKVNNGCKSFNCLSSKSIRSNQACNNKRIAQTDLINEILKYAQVVETSGSASNVVNRGLGSSDLSYLQCSLCFSLLADPDELKLHIVQTHVYNDNLNKCMVCCYCR
jgi:hypothetical protein